jgi:hypothetical protein
MARIIHTTAYWLLIARPRPLVPPAGLPRGSPVRQITTIWS